MSLLSRKGLLARIRRSKESRDRLVSSNLEKGIAFQIKATRDAREWTQAELAKRTDMTQNNISRLESPDYGRYTIGSLKRIAAALDVALIVRFVPFSQYISWLSGSQFMDLGLRPEALAVLSFADEEEARGLDAQLRYWAVSSQPAPAVSAPSIQDIQLSPDTPKQAMRTSTILQPVPYERAV